MLGIKRTSAWTFNTSATGGAGVGFVVASGGGIALNKPDASATDDPIWLHYAGAGGGLSAGVRRMPKVGKIIDSRSLSEKGGGNVGPSQFWNHGVVYVMNGHPTNELTLDDFKGFCTFIDIGAGLILGYAGFGLLMNINPHAVQNASPSLLGMLEFASMASPHAMLLSRGWNVGPQANVGVSLSAGWVW